MATEVKEQSWRYKVKLNDPLEAKKALGELMEEGNDDELTDIDISDDVDCSVKGCVVYRNGTEELIALDDKPIHLDYEAQTIQLPKELVELYPLDDTSFPAKLVRYVGMPTGGFRSERNEGDVVVLSLWNGKRDIVNINLLAEDSKQAMLLLSAVTRLVYESASKNSPRTHKFYPIEEGPVDVASCSVAKRDKMDIEKERKGLVRKQKSGGEETMQTDEPEEELADLKTEPKFYIFDEESLLLYDSAFASMPAVDLRFYREEKHPKTIETIFVCKTEDQLEIQQGKKVYFIRPRMGDKLSEEKYKRLVKYLKKGRVIPKSEELFKGTGSDFEKIFSPQAPEPYETDSDEALGDLKGNPIVNAVPKRTKYSKKPSTEPTGSRPSGPSGTVTKTPDNTDARSKSNGDGQRDKIWLENMLTANHVTEVMLRTDDPQSGRMQEEWFMKEPELQKILNSGTAPVVDPNDSEPKLDPQSLPDMCRALNLVRDSINTNQYAEAIVRLRRCLSVFDKTLLKDLGHGDDLIEVMKRIYFLQDRPTGM